MGPFRLRVKQRNILEYYGEEEMKFKPGDKVWCIVSKDHYNLPPGPIAAVVIRYCLNPFNPPWANQQAYRIEIEGHPLTGGWTAPEGILEPRHDPYEGDQEGSWDTCPYKPETVLV